MFTFEIKINGSLIGHIYGINISDQYTKEDKNIYRYEYYEVSTRSVISGVVKHNRDKGVIPLLQLILDDVHKKETKDET